MTSRAEDTFQQSDEKLMLDEVRRCLDQLPDQTRFELLELFHHVPEPVRGHALNFLRKLDYIS